MNNKGSVRDNSLFRHIKISANKVGTSYIYKLVSRILSFLGTILLIFLVVIGSLMFYFNSKAKAYQRQGVNYVPPFGLYTIISGSMEPSIHVYDVVVSVSERDLSKIKVGDIITFISTWDVNYGKTITHRVISVSKNTQGEYRFTTKGDNNDAQDGATVSQSNFVGKVVMRIPQLGRLQFLLATKMGWFGIVFIPALGVIIYDVFKILKLVVLKKKLNDVSDVENINPDGTFKEEYLASIETDNQTNLNSEMVNGEQVETFAISEPAPVVGAGDVVNNSNVNIEIIDQNNDSMNIQPIAETPLEEPINIVSTQDVTPIVNSPAPEIQVAPVISPPIEQPVEQPPVEENVLPNELENVELPKTTETVNEGIIDNAPQEINSNIVQTSNNRSPILRRDQRNDNKESTENSASIEETKPSTPAKVIDLEDLQNIELPVMKANANSDDGGPLTKRI